MSLSDIHIPPFLRMLWKHISAGVALVLIVLALFLGFRFGQGAPSTSQPVAGTSDDEPQGEQLYTCSMHPWVRLKHPDDKCPICGMDVIPLSSVQGTGSAHTISLSEEQTMLGRVETTKVKRFFPTAEVRLYGRVTYDETSVARITAYFPGRIDRLFVNYMGVSIAKG
ncbi:MAG TPA: hypothetical protein ENJ00_08630, partial [Phycisphaerales bacterium]|nr:hypothetical protein [Phycisphaerales bacterium]